MVRDRWWRRIEKNFNFPPLSNIIIVLTQMLFLTIIGPHHCFWSSLRQSSKNKALSQPADDHKKFNCVFNEALSKSLRIFCSTLVDWHSLYSFETGHIYALDFAWIWHFLTIFLLVRFRNYKLSCIHGLKSSTHKTKSSSFFTNPSPWKMTSHHRSALIPNEGYQWEQWICM